MEHPFFMNGAGNTSRAEAIRWLSIAEKLLTNRDLVGSKSFATRAHESDPTLLPADQILAIVDTLIAGDKRINNQHLDYYSILQIPSNQTHDSELIANQYRRLALLLNPQKNNFPFSDHAFHLVVDAWSVLSNAFRRSVYDKEIGFFLNLNPVSSPPPPTNNPVGFMQQSSMIFQSQPQSHPVSSVPSSSRERQTVTFLQDPQPQSMTSVSSLTREQQPVTFLSRNQTQPVNSTMLSPDREQHPFTFGSSTTRAQQQVAFAESTRGQQQVAFAESTRGPQQAAFAESTRGPQQVAFVKTTRGQQQVASVESTRGQHRVASMESRREQQEVASVHQQGNKQAPQRNEGLLGNNQNFSASTGRNVNNEGLFGNNQNHSVSTGGNVNNAGLFGNNQNHSASISKNVNNEGVFGNNQNHSASISKNVNNEGLFGNNQNQSASTNRNVNNEGLFGSNQNQSANTSHNNEVFFGNNQNHSVSTSNNNVRGKERSADASSHVVPSFWTACPYCYLMYEYPLEYVDCTLRCQKCKRAFQAVKIASPPSIIEGQEAYFCCWGFMPLGFSLEIFKKYKGNISSWTPFAPIFNKHGGVRKPAAPRVYIDDYEDVFLGLSESSEESDEDWKGDNKMKKAKSGKRKSKRIRRKKAKIQKSDKGKNVVVNAGDDVQDVSATQGGVEVPNVTTAQSSKRAGNTRRQAGRVTKDVGKLDLNVEFSNEVEEPPAPGMGQGNGAGTGEDGNIEGIEFFEGLDEFLSSLPILNAVGDDKVKAA
uniref:Putative ovule protein n=2 Tax=Solanum chacoense TaxID=4108 RepID=A0A0V0IPA7_SOLCH